jgi:hypothetical protein
LHPPDNQDRAGRQVEHIGLCDETPIAPLCGGFQLAYVEPSVVPRRR